MSAVPTPDTGPDAGAVWHYGDPFGEQRFAQTAAVLVDRSHRAVLTVTGRDRLSWLHTVCTQHVSALGEGAVTDNLILDGKGHVVEHWVQTEIGHTTYFDTESDRRDALLGYLRRMVFWADVTIESVDFAVLSLLGPELAGKPVLAALGIDALPAPASATRLSGSAGGFVRRNPDRSRIWLDMVVPRDEIEDWTVALTEAGVHLVGVWAFEAERVAALRPRLGVDIDERTIPHEVGWLGGPGEGAVHLDKGCYRGQETVARVHNLGKPPRMMVLLHLDGSADRPSHGDAVLAGGRQVGRLGTVVDHCDLGPIALALLKRGLPADTELVTGPEGEVAARIDATSMPPPDERGAGRVAIDRLRGRDTHR